MAANFETIVEDLNLLLYPPLTNLMLQYVGSLVVDSQNLWSDCHGLAWFNGFLWFHDADGEWKCTFWRKIKTSSNMSTRNSAKMYSVHTAPTFDYHTGWLKTSEGFVAKKKKKIVTLEGFGVHAKKVTVEDQYGITTISNCDLPEDEDLQVSQCFFVPNQGYRWKGYFSASAKLYCAKVKHGEKNVQLQCFTPFLEQRDAPIGATYWHSWDWRLWCVLGNKIVMCRQENRTIIVLLANLEKSQSWLRIDLDSPLSMAYLTYCVADDVYVYLVCDKKLYQVQLFS